MKSLDETLERATLEIARSLWPKGWHTSLVAPANLAQLVASYKANGYITVSSRYSDRTIFSTPDVNYAFRAWHDWHHIRLNAEFDGHGERLVYSAMSDDFAGWWINNMRSRDPDPAYQRSHALLECENIGQLDYWERFGAPPDDQRVFACGYLAARGLL